ncbi:MAG: DNA-directed RNA polymerase subunit omega [Planctomycetes bacterium]|jgi:DNA-directed RNA polymerase subunit K/omega|nr:DNA-directed RNA polymerase subunit omega [Planctomycetota bacterium]
MTTELIRRIDVLAEQVGGRFKLASLIQRRLQEIIRTAPHAIHQAEESPIRMVIREIEEGKIELEPDEEKVDTSVLGG